MNSEGQLGYKQVKTRNKSIIGQDNGMQKELMAKEDMATSVVYKYGKQELDHKEL